MPKDIPADLIGRHRESRRMREEHENRSVSPEAVRRNQ